MLDRLFTTFLGTFQRMVFWELLRVFLLALTGLTAMFVVAGVIQQATQFGLSLSQVLTIIPLIVPTSLPYTIPSTTLFASCVAYGRLSHDNEAVVLKAAGVDLYSLLRPAFFLGLFAAVATAGLSYQVIPSSVRQLNAEVIRDPEESLYNLLRRERVFKSGSAWVLYVREVQGRRLIDVVVKQKKSRPAPGDPEFEYVARAREARLVIDAARGKMKVDADTWDAAGTKMESSIGLQDPLEVDIPDEFRPEKLLGLIASRPQAIDWPNLPGKARESLTGGAADAYHIRDAILSVPPHVTLDVPGQLALDVRYGFAMTKKKLPTGEEVVVPSGRVPAEPGERAKQAQHYLEIAQFHERTYRTLMLEYHMRPALAFGCIVFALIGCPVGMWANRADYLSIFVVCFLPTLFGYYPILLSGAGLSRDGKVPMPVGVWAANVAAGFVALVLTWRLVKR